MNIILVYLLRHIFTTRLLLIVDRESHIVRGQGYHIYNDGTGQGWLYRSNLYLNVSVRNGMGGTKS